MESMTAGPPLSFDLVDQALENVNSVAGAPEAHGGLCGMACVFGNRAAAIWVAELSDELSHANPDRPESGDVLGQLANVTCQGLSEGDMSFTLLLPPDDRPIADRAGALADWCTGFMNGLGQAAADQGSFDLMANELAREILENFSEIARATPGEEESEAESEAAYAELVEFVRVSVQLVFEELYIIRKASGAPGLH